MAEDRKIECVGEPFKGSLAKAMGKDDPITREEFDTLRSQVADIHAFIEGLAGALNNPMVRAMMPPNMRGFIGGN